MPIEGEDPPPIKITDPKDKDNKSTNAAQPEDPPPIEPDDDDDD